MLCSFSNVTLLQLPRGMGKHLALSSHLSPAMHACADVLHSVSLPMLIDISGIC